jgi:hypothetical protein
MAPASASPEFVAALDAFKRAAVNLSIAWEKEQSPTVENYPPEWPDFDEVVAQVVGMEPIR